MSTTFSLPYFNVGVTEISQYANSPVIDGLVQNFGQYFDPTVNLTQFYNIVWNITTAQGFGLDIWGRILGISRYLQLPSSTDYFGFNNSTSDWQPFGQAPFFDGATGTTTYALSDASYLTLLMAKAFSNVCRTTIPVLNQLLMLVFGSSGECWVDDTGDMTMEFVFNFTLSTLQDAILTQSGAIPHPTGVEFTVVMNNLILDETGDDLLTELGDTMITE